MQQFNAVNDAMKAQTPLNVWRPFLAPNVIPNLPQVPKDLDLIESRDIDYRAGRDSVWRVYEVLASRQYITDMAASKVLYLKRPSLIAISDSYVRGVLLGPDQPVFPQDPAPGGQVRGSWRRRDGRDPASWASQRRPVAAAIGLRP